MHLLFGQSPCDVFRDKVQVTEAGQKRDIVPLCDFEGCQVDSELASETFQRSPLRCVHNFKTAYGPLSFEMLF